MFETLTVEGAEVPDERCRWCRVPRVRVEQIALSIFPEPPPPTHTVYPESTEGRALMHQRLLLGLSLRQAEARLGLDAQTINALEHGRQVFRDPEDWRRAAELLALPLVAGGVR